jgi:nucleoside-diphosphate-sugar epimerase
MAGRKFGTQGAIELTWAMNVLVPANAAHRYRDSKIVVFSTGCVYPLVDAASSGCSEDVPPDPRGDYAMSCLGRERVFAYASQSDGTRVCQFRLNYATACRYGVLHDIGMQVWNNEPVNRSVGQFNALWQGDVNNQALLSLSLCRSPFDIINVTGPEKLSTTWAAEEFGRLRALYRKGQNLGHFRPNVTFEAWVLVMISVSYFYFANMQTMSKTLGLDLTDNATRTRLVNEMLTLLTPEPTP